MSLRKEIFSSPAWYEQIKTFIILLQYLSFMGWLKRLLPLSGKKKKHFDEFRIYLDKEKLKLVKSFLAENKVGVYYDYLKNSFVKPVGYPQLNIMVEEPNLGTYVSDINRIVANKANEHTFELFVENSGKILELIAPHLVGFDEVKKACFLQLFSKERFHILLLGDPGTGKTDILRSMNSLSPISTFGLGSGTSGVGLAATKKGKEIIQGLLPRANNGICCIDELNLMKKTDRGSLLNTMEKGFITYDKGSTHIRLQAKTRILATANPTGDRFIGKRLETYQKQLPFDQALMSRFHLVFLIQRPNKEQFLRITKHILTSEKAKINIDDVAFVKKYIDYAMKLNVNFNKKFEELVSSFIDKLKDDEDKFLVELSPRIVHGIVNMAKASARSQLRTDVIDEDVVEALKLVKKAYYF